MYLASDFRSIARKALREFWTLTIGVTLVAMLLGDGLDFMSSSASGSRITDGYHDSVYIDGPGFSMSGGFLDTPLVSQMLAVILPIITVLAVVQLLIGGAIELGLKRYNLNLLIRVNRSDGALIKQTIIGRRRIYEWSDPVSIKIWRNQKIRRLALGRDRVSVYGNKNSRYS